MTEDRKVVCELERTVDCHEASWHTRHDEAKYDRYENKFKAVMDERFGGEDWVYSRNPGPKAHGMHCKASNYHKKLWHSMVKNEKTLRWSPDVTFCYPRVGSFEVSAVKGKQRVTVFSKLTTRKWPQAEWLADRFEDIVKTKLGGWEPLPEVKKVERKYATGKLTDDELRAMVKKKFGSIIAAFRSFDKNGDGEISKAEFMKGIRTVGIDLPPAQREQLWKMADEDGTGNIQYQEFARKFSSYKASHSLHRHADYRKDGKQELVQSLHGVDAASRVQKHAAIRQSQELSWGVEADKLADNPNEALEALEKQGMSIMKLSRDAAAMSKNIEEMSPDEIRAKIYKKHGNLVNAFRHFDFDGDSSISYEEFMRHLPTVLGEAISQSKVDELWKAYDPDMSGEIDMQEFANTKVIGHLATVQGVKTFKGHAVDPTLTIGNKASSKNAMVGEMRYDTKGALSQVKTANINDLSTIAASSKPPSPDTMIVENPQQAC